MKSSSGQYFIALDHIRGLAAFLVFTWHFIQAGDGQHAGPLIFPTSILTEGHTGVALFMTLSGYLFAKLLDSREINFPLFIWNRFLRLAPLLFFVIFIVGCIKYAHHENVSEYAINLLKGFALPVLPNGGWSITIEFHFYFLLPLLLFIRNRKPHALLLIILAALLCRLVLHDYLGEVQKLAYWTIVGRIDQFVLGILAYQYRQNITAKSALIIAILFSLFYTYFDSLGGFYNAPDYPSPSRIWIVLPTLEGLCYAAVIAWYDNAVKHSHSRSSRFFALIGTYSYSIYLLHFFFVFSLSNYIHAHIVDLSNLYIAMLLSAPCFLLMIPVAALSYHLIELPFLQYRSRYLR